MIYEIIVDSGETANKCTIAPLASRADFRIFRVHGEKPLGPLSAPILLHHEGQCLSELRSHAPAISALASIDCVWRRLSKLQNRIQWAGEKEPLLAKIPEGFKTTYPRTAAKNTDPDGGLATIEAIFVAAALLGKFDLSLLSKYYFARQFIELNSHRFLDFGIQEITSATHSLPPLPVRNSLTRRQNRGRIG